MSYIRLFEMLAADVPTPPTDKFSFFFDSATGEPSFKDDAGVVTSLVGTPGQGVPIGGTAGQVLEKIDGTDYNTQWVTPSGVSDGDKGDITVSASGATWAIDAGVVTYAKMQDISAQFRVLGRNSASAGDAEEVTFTQLLDWVGSAADGDLLYRSGGSWTRLGVGTNGHILTLAAGLPTWAAGGGGGLTNWTDSLNSSGVNATTPVAVFTATNAATNVDAAIVSKGNGAFVRQIPDGTATGGNKRGANAVDLQSTRSTAAQVASGINSFTAGQSNTASATRAVAMGDASVASANAAVAIGDTCTASGTNSVALGRLNTASATGSVALGESNTANAAGSVAMGQSNTIGGTTGIYSHAKGRDSTARGIVGVEVYSASAFAAVGDAQRGIYILRSDTTNATPETLTSNNSAASATNHVVLPNNSTYGFDGLVVCRSSTDWKVWKVSGGINRGANAAATAVGVTGATIVVLDATAGAAAWTFTATADTTLGSLKQEVTGAAATNIKWVEVTNTAEVAG